MRKAGRLSAECLDMLAPHVVPGVTTGKLDDLAREFVLDHGSLPACLFYKGYRHTVCTSINHVVCHGIPGPKALKEGDIVNIDVTVIVDGWHGDTSRMYSVGEVKRKGHAPDGRHLRVHDEGHRGGEARRARLGDIGAAIQDACRRQRYSVVEAFCGHGLGRVFHDSPNILHFRQRPARRDARIACLQPGMIFTIEPMINLGRPRCRAAVGWLDGGDARPLAVGAVRACDRRDRDGLRDLHPVADRPAYAAHVRRSARPDPMAADRADSAKAAQARRADAERRARAQALSRPSRASAPARAARTMARTLPTTNCSNSCSAPSFRASTSSRSPRS